MYLYIFGFRIAKVPLANQGRPLANQGRTLANQGQLQPFR